MRVARGFPSIIKRWPNERKLLTTLEKHLSRFKFDESRWECMRVSGQTTARIWTLGIFQALAHQCKEYTTGPNSRSALAWNSHALLATLVDRFSCAFIEYFYQYIYNNYTTCRQLTSTWQWPTRKRKLLWSLCTYSVTILILSSFSLCILIVLYFYIFSFWQTVYNNKKLKKLKLNLFLKLKFFLRIVTVFSRSARGDDSWWQLRKTLVPSTLVLVWAHSPKLRICFLPL